jgi:AcrR family transcriptional regulator
MSRKPTIMKARKVAHSKAPRKTDRRITRTRNVLGDALVALLHERTFDEITVKDVLDRAGVGRSTFYAHFRDKEDLFLSDVEDFLEQCSTILNRQKASAERLLPVQEVFAHIRKMRAFYAALVRNGKINDVQTLARGVFARSIEERLRSANLKMSAVERSAQACALAGSFFSLLDWWIDKGMKIDPKEMDTLFHVMAWKGLGRRQE